MRAVTIATTTAIDRRSAAASQQRSGVHPGREEYALATGADDLDQWSNELNWWQNSLIGWSGI
jgi:hypothetical protein